LATLNPKMASISGSGQAFVLTLLKNIKKSEIGNWMPTQNSYFLTEFFQINIERIDWL